ncbi:MAG: tRNA (adenosine(37)-N6)-dimethylallyltransferase MiaA [Bacteroidales bacterium]|nr:tRNA (adenosine(37)-N6)-dimethylallyltransferase MiaA [Bacteroidales bacterium]MBR3572600.1 tRNA (adenosine(37)-N6)-dimethylallyltransferase MiaA [Bacteroidales bacterium]
MTSDRTLLVITGPTAVGKTDYTISLAEQLGAPIISADSRQMFRELKIGTAAPTEAELARVKHYFVGNLSIHDYYNVSIFEQQVLELLETLFLSHPVVIMTGGSPQYIDAVCNGIDELPDPEPGIRQYVNNLFKTNGIDALRAQLALLDPDYYERVNHNDHKRMIRAVEVSLQMKKPYSQCLHQTKKERHFKIEKYYLNRPRDVLFERINRRVDAMMEQGLLEEARQLLPYRDLNALNTVGYKELFDYFDGKCSLEQAVEDIKTHTRRYAKRQLTWFKRDYIEKMMQD